MEDVKKKKVKHVTKKVTKSSGKGTQHVGSMLGL